MRGPRTLSPLLHYSITHGKARHKHSTTKYLGIVYPVTSKDSNPVVQGFAHIRLAIHV